MFTGIVQSLGRVESVRSSAQDREFVVACDGEVTDRLSLGASIALDGVCQTVTRLERGRFEVHAIAETLRVTTLGESKVGDRLHLETALGAGEPLGGHFVQGHVDGTARIVAREARGDSTRFGFEAARELVAQLVPKGSVCLDGISLTLGPEITEVGFEVFLIPHTLDVTHWVAKGPGHRVNLETDVLGKYVLRYLGRMTPPQGNLDWESLHRAGFDTPPPRGGGR